MQVKFTDWDRCPGCRKKVQAMVADKMEIIVLVFGALVCPLCGSVFFTSEMKHEVMAEMKRKIILPGDQKKFFDKVTL